MTGAAVYLMTGQAPDLTSEKGQRESGWIRGNKTDGMMVFFVIMAVETKG
jgi:hypothetical protein